MILKLPQIGSYPLPDETGDIYVPVRHCTEHGEMTNTHLSSVLANLHHAGHPADQIDSIRSSYRLHGHATLPWSADRPAEWIESTHLPEGWAGTLTDGEPAGSTGERS